MVGRVDLLLASPECTNHSCAKGAGPRSEESRLTALQILRYSRALQPRWLILENVVHMRPWSRYDELLRGLEILGYKVREQIIDSTEFGVPQRRKRLFITCDRKTTPPEILPARYKPRSAWEILDPPGTWNARPLFGGYRARATLDRARRGFKALGQREPFLIVYYGTDGCGGWQRLDQPLRTITTLDRFGLVEPNPMGPTLRMLQVSELRRAMGISRRFRLDEGTRRDRIKLLGNGVCPPVMAAIVRGLTRPAAVVAC
jgi:DNA (cytosine-5)-methyltransferase 1